MADERSFPLSFKGSTVRFWNKLGVLGASAIIGGLVVRRDVRFNAAESVVSLGLRAPSLGLSVACVSLLFKKVPKEFYIVCALEAPSLVGLGVVLLLFSYSSEPLSSLVTFDCFNPLESFTWIPRVTIFFYNCSTRDGSFSR